MKNRIIYLLILAAGIMLTFTQCKDIDDNTLSPEQESFIEKTDYGVYASSVLFTYDENTCQTATGPAANSIRIQTDDMAKYVSVVLDAVPALNKDLKGDVALKGIGNSSGGNGQSLKILKMQDGKVWVWNNDAKQGYLLPWK